MPKAKPEILTKAERDQLLQIVKKREKVMRASAVERSGVLLAEFDRQSAKIYSFDDDSIWKQATERAKEVVARANEEIAARSAELGIPKEFAPFISMGWIGRNESAIAQRRAELRRAARSKIEAIQLEALTAIERASLAAQEEIVLKGLQNEAAKAFLENMPSLESLMPGISAEELRTQIEGRKYAPQNQALRAIGLLEEEFGG